RSLRTFPTGDAFSDEAIRVMESCHKKLLTGTTDDRLLKGLEIEYRLFKSVEQKLCSGEIAGPFLDVDAFLQTAATIMNRRKSRAGRSLENHVDEAMTREGIPHDIRARDIQGAPDIVVPNVAAYMDPKWPRSRVFVIGVKTTCKDRWRQIVNEGPLVKRKYLLTTQQGISEPQLAEMARSNVTLVVPQGLHSYYPPSARKGILTVDRFFAQMQNALDA
ncbi:MAG: type II restriction endonuclease, partial [Acidobacteria bacterium]